MRQIPWARIAVSIFFVGLLATPAVMRWRLAQRTLAAHSTLDRQAALARHGFYLEEVSHAAGIDFVHQAPTLDAKLNPIMPEVASMGASVSIVDFDRDGLICGHRGRWGWGFVFSLGGFESSLHRVSFVVLEEFVHLLEHLFDAQTNGVAFFVEGGEFGFGGAGGALLGG